MSEASAAVLLRAMPLGEADVVVVAHTERWGKVRAAARAARRSKRRFAGGLQPGAVGEATLQPGRGGLWRLDGFVPRLDHTVMGRDLDRFAYVAYLCELTDALVDEHHPEPGLHHAIEAAVARTLAEPVDPLVLRAFEVQLLFHLGLLPAFESCCVCGGQIEGQIGDQSRDQLGAATVAFDPGRGGALCPAHGAGAPMQPGRLLRAAAALARGEPTGDLGPHDRRALRDLLHRPIQAQLRAPLRSTELFAQLAGSRTSRAR